MTGLDYDVENRLARRGLGGAWWLALLAIPLLLAALLAFIKGPDIEDDLTKRSGDALAAAGFEDVKVEFDGRDGTLTVPDGVDADAAIKAVEGVEGVRVADAVDGAAEPEPTEPTDASPTEPAPTSDAACKAVQDELSAALRANPIRFAENSSTITDRGAITKAANLLKSCGTAVIEVSGHTDNQGPENVPLSQRRADAVKALLVQAGISGDRITAKGYGSSKPVASNDTEAGRAQNRRIDITVQ